MEGGEEIDWGRDAMMSLIYIVVSTAHSGPSFENLCDWNLI